MNVKSSDGFQLYSYEWKKYRQVEDAKNARVQNGKKKIKDSFTEAHRERQSFTEKIKDLKMSTIPFKIITEWQRV